MAFAIIGSITFMVMITLSAAAEYKVGVLLIRDHGTPYDVARAGAAIELAFEDVNSRLLNASAKHRLTPVMRTYGPECDARDAPGLAADMFYLDKVVAFIGPGCSLALAPVANLARTWNVPVITGVGDSGEFYNKANYPLVTRLAYCQCRLRMVVGSVLERFGWTDLTVISDRDDTHASILGDSMDHGLQLGGYLPEIIKYYGNSEHDYVKYLKEASEHSRIIILCVPGESLRDFLLTAYDLGYVQTGEYVFLFIELFSYNATDYWGDFSWRKGDEHDEKARLAYEAAIKISLEDVVDGAQYEEFSARVIQRSKEKYNFDYGSEHVNFFVAAFYDAVWLYGLAVSELLAAGQDIRDGLRTTHHMWNRTFTVPSIQDPGLTRSVVMNDNGDRDTVFAINDMDPKTGLFKPVGHWVFADGFIPEPGTEFHWAGGRTTPPLNTPVCGFRNENPICQETETMSVAAIALLAALVTAVVAAVVGFLSYRRFKLESEIQDVSWIIPENDITKSTRNPNSIPHSLSKIGDSLYSKLTGNEQVFASVGTYKGTSVVLRRLKKRKVHVKRSLLVEVKQRRGLTHDNVCHFVGAVLDPGAPVVVLHAYCRKGSLQDLLCNDSITLDTVFKMSLIQDIIKGLEYIHGSPIHQHGRLRSSNCVIDSRFILKLTDFGLPTFYEEEDFESKDDERYFYRLLWTAPEHLPPAVESSSQKGDIYSLGIILQEIFTRNGPYEQRRDEGMTLKDIIQCVRSKFVPAFRPKVSVSTSSEDLHRMMTMCWDNSPEKRPELSTLRITCRAANKGSGDSSNLLDNLLTRMEQYANNLEGLVAERTQLLLQEQKKTEQLLLQILPKSIADKLKFGQTVEPENFDCVTIYFSDIVGFTQLSAQSQPLQVVQLLNDLYTLFDDIVDKYDVYKVETIGDAYMIVSGLPIKNGQKHASEVARTALNLLKSIKSFTIRHMPHEKLMLRIGVHSGPCVAGVVGVKMPRYCLFGDTVNTASRMESNGEALKIHISEQTKEILGSQQEFSLVERGEISIKGKGMMKTYWLEETASY